MYLELSLLYKMERETGYLTMSNLKNLNTFEYKLTIGLLCIIKFLY